MESTLSQNKDEEKKKTVLIKLVRGPERENFRQPRAMLLSTTPKRRQRELRKVGKATLNHASF